MTDDPMAAALARLHAEYPDLPTDGGPVWEPVQDEAEDAEAPTPIPLRWGLNDVLWGDDDSVTVLLSGPDGEPYWLELDPERAAVLRQDLAGPDGEAPQPGPPADLCQFHGPTGVPCDCGCDAGADCHPRELAS